eukprot:2261764-Prymnesium_polylepis.1
MQRTTPDVGIERRWDWADLQPAMVFKLPNAVIEGSEIRLQHVNHEDQHAKPSYLSRTRARGSIECLVPC